MHIRFKEELDYEKNCCFIVFECGDVFSIRQSGVFAQGITAQQSSMTYNVCIEGQVSAELADKDIAMIVLRDSDGSVVHMDQFRTNSDSTYTYKFKSKYDLSQGYVLRVLNEQNNITDSIISATQQSEIKIIAYETDFDGESYTINIQNKFCALPAKIDRKKLQKTE